MSEVFVSTVHPTLGRLYWVFTSNADCNYPEHYSLTDRSELATRFPKGWRDHHFYHWRHRSHISKVFEPDDPYSDYEEFEDDGRLEQRLSGLLADLHARSRQAVEEFREAPSKAAVLGQKA
ncbi:hypothetical protein [Pseudomonas meliae]|uniref:hypothetical protein n=2 Tax=Pseudomonas meliae TaxID=86176 RepID=UPI0005C88263|nr:hypothetical protein [Pseudomonas meliae]